MKITELDAPVRASLYVLCEDTRAIGDRLVCYRLYATLERGKSSRFFVSVVEDGDEDGALVPREGLEEAAALYRTLLRATVTPCHFADIVRDLDKERYGVY